MEEAEDIEVRLKDGCMLRGKVYHPPSSPARTVALCIHGMGVDCNVWQFVAREWVSSGGALICFDLRGHGLSDQGRHPLVGPRGMAADLIQACETLGVTPDVVIGQSFGNLVLLEMLPAVAERWRARQFIAITPVWTAARPGVKGFLRHLKGTALFLSRVGKGIHFQIRRQRKRRDHTEFAHSPDHHMPRFCAEARATGWFRYAWLMLCLQLSRRRMPNWTDLAPLPVRIIGATNEGLWDNGQLSEIARLTGWPLHWMEMRHVSLSTESVYAPELVRLLHQQGVLPGEH